MGYKEGSNIRTIQDIQNLVVGLIFESNKEFTVEELVEKVKGKLNGSSFSIDDARLNKIIKDNLSMLASINTIRHNGDKYSL